MRVVIAPDKFKGSVGAPEVAVALAAGIERARPELDLALCPMADGGEGTADVLRVARDGVVRRVQAHDPWGRALEAPVLELGDGSVVIESASASGLRATPTGPNALSASSYGTGELIVASLETGATRVVVGVGGTATTDGGTGAARAAGWSFLDSRGAQLAPGGGSLCALARIVPPPNGRPPVGVEVIAACDVATPLVGPDGCARVFGPQKGASPEDVAVLAEGLERLAERIRDDLGVDVREPAHAGAGGGLGAGLRAFFGAELVSGFDFVAREVGLESLIEGADLVITAEGRVDEQTFLGKAPGRVARMSAHAGVPCWVMAGEITLGTQALEEAGFQRAVALVDRYGRSASLARVLDLLSEEAARLIMEWPS